MNQLITNLQSALSIYNNHNLGAVGPDLNGPRPSNQVDFNMPPNPNQQPKLNWVHPENTDNATGSKPPRNWSETGTTAKPDWCRNIPASTQEFHPGKPWRTSPPQVAKLDGWSVTDSTRKPIIPGQPSIWSYNPEPVETDTVEKRIEKAILNILED